MLEPGPHPEQLGNVRAFVPRSGQPVETKASHPQVPGLTAGWGVRTGGGNPSIVAQVEVGVSNDHRLSRPVRVSARANDVSTTADVTDGEVVDHAAVAIRREHLDIIHAAMRDDVALDEGTGKHARVKDFAVCGKTGTAEVKAGSRLIDRITWFASFGPFESPRYAVVVMVESGGSGGGTCAPVARRIYEYLRDRERGATHLGQN